MAKFTFLPGRSKKSPATPTPSEPMTKAHKILGSTNISIDNVSSTNLAISPSEGKPPRGVHGHGGTRMNAAGADALLKELEREWSEESDIAPRYLGVVDDERLHVSDPGVSDPNAMLRQQNSSSTIRSWYDRSKMPLAISQQTSASAMAKGLPTKAERVLDMDNALAAMSKNNNSKKKPAKLDLSRLKPLGRARKGSDWEEHAHAGDIKRSPSALSPRNLYRRPTYEHLRRAPSPEPVVRPTTSGQPRTRHPHHEHMNELPNLYKHYEQMSFAQVLGEKMDTPEQQRSTSRNDAPVELPAELPADTYASYRSRHGKMKESVDHGPSTNPTSPIEHSHFTQIVRAPTPTKAEEQASPTSYAASVSSRHTRTSKASKRTETSFQMADLQEKSVLMLSSDSEEDEDIYAGSPARRRTSPTSGRPLSTASNSIASSYDGRPEESSPREGHDPAVRQSNSTVKKLSTTADDLLNIPSNALGKTSTLLSPSNSSLGSSHWGATFHLPATPSTLSLASESITAPTRVWHESTSGSELFDAQSVGTQAPSTLASRESQQDWNNRSYFDSRYSGTTSGRGSRPPVRPQSSQPTPPLSPSSMDFFIQSARSSIDARTTSSNEPVMNLTRQEQLLITALRQRREDMRKASLLIDDRQASRHQSKPSEATITDQSLQSEFPSTTGSSSRSARLSSLRASDSIASSLNLPISGVREGEYGDNESTFTTDSPVFLLSPPPPSRYKPITIPKRLSQVDSERMTPADDQMVMYLDSPAGPALTISEGVMSPEASGFEDSFASMSERSPGSPHSSQASPRSKRESVQRQVSIKVGHSEKIWPAISPLLPPQRELPPIPTKRRPVSIDEEEEEEEEDDGIPRPDSPVDCPISPMAKQFPEVPKDRQTAKNQAARLSAFGPPSPLEAGWWGDSD